MTKTVSSDLATHKGKALTTLARCVKVKRTDGTILGFTTVDKELSIDLSDGDGSITYSPETALSPSAISSSADLAPESMSVLGFLDADAITDEDIRAGRYDFAEVVFFEVNYEDLTQGVLYASPARYIIGQVELRDNSFTAELRPLSQRYSQTVGELVTVDCRADLGDTRCKVRTNPDAWAASTAYTVREDGDADTGSVVKPATDNGFHFKCTVAGTSGASEPTWPTTEGDTVTDGTVTWEAIKALSQTGTVTSVTDNANFVASGISIEADWWTLGTIEWLTGANEGLRGEVKADDGAGTIELYLPAAFDISAGSPADTFRITVGCNKIFRDSEDGTVIGHCISRFDNALNFRGEPDVPGVDVALDYPDAR